MQWSNRLYRHLLAVWLIVTVIGCATPAHAAWYTSPQRLTSPDQDAGSPCLSGGRIAYALGGFVWTQDLATGFTNRVSMSGWPVALSGDNLLCDGIGSSSQAVFFHLPTASKNYFGMVDTWPTVEYPIDIGGSYALTRVFNEEYNPLVKTRNIDIWAYDLTTGEGWPLSTNLEMQFDGAVQGSQAVYDDNSAGNWDVYVYDLKTRTSRRLTDSPVGEGSPDIWGDTVVYRNEDGEVRVFDLSTNTSRLLPIPAQRASGDPYGPGRSAAQIDGSKIVYRDARDGVPRVYVYDLVSNTEHVVATVATVDMGAAISGDRVVWADKGIVDGVDRYSIFGAQLAKTQLSVQVASPVAYSASATVTGRLNDEAGAAIPSRSVLIQKSSDGRSWTDVATVSSGADGSFAGHSPKTTHRTYLRAVFNGDADYPGAISLLVSVTPEVSLGAPVAPKTMKKSKSYTVYGSLKPKHMAGSKVVRIHKYKKVGKKWRSMGYVKAKAYNHKGYTRYKVKMKLTSKGKWRLRAYALADSKHAATWSSKYDSVTVK